MVRIQPTPPKKRVQFRLQGNATFQKNVSKAKPEILTDAFDHTERLLLEISWIN